MNYVSLKLLNQIEFYKRNLITNGKKILISAYACKPGFGSEAGTGWNFAIAMAKRHRVWVLAQSVNKNIIEEAVQNVPNIEFIYCGFGKIAGFMKKKKITIQFHYYLWQIKAYFVAKKHHKKIKFNLVHHLTLVKYSIPSFLYLLHVPFLFGPVGGGESIPKNFWKELSARGKIFEMLRLIGRRIGEIDPFNRRCIAKADHVVATTSETLQRLKNFKYKAASILPAIGISNDDIHRKTEDLKSNYNNKRKILMIGNFLQWKGFSLGIKAFAQANLDNAELWIIGKGPDARRLKGLASKLEILDKTKFHKWVSRSELLNILNHAHVLLHPSLHESGGNVCVEAMINRLPVICLNIGGPGTIVPDDAGIKITPNDPKSTVMEISNALKLLIHNDDIREKMGEIGFNWSVDHYIWDRFAENIDKIYSKILLEHHAG